LRHWRLSPRLTDWTLALAVGAAIVTGVVGLDSAHPEQWLVFALHGIAGFWLLFFTWGKLTRVWPRLIAPRRWDRRTLLGLGTTLLVGLAVGSGIWWVAGGDVALAGYNLMNWHIVLGVGLGLFVLLHMRARAKRLRPRDLGGRRQALEYGALLVSSVALWPAQQALDRALALPGVRRRFTGSREVGSFAGNAFPTSSWVADAPLPLAPDTWQLAIGGAVATPQSLSYDELLAFEDEIEATLDCTGGFYSAQRWRGARVGTLLDRAQPLSEARWVGFVSVTGYRWSLPIAEAREALLATQVGGEPLSHEHGAPARLVAPGRRGFQWVKWVVRIEARTDQDYGELLAIHTSSFTPEGRGER
jgi:DMSO/TMAO reductase YedYZ molybdopterin-dependent catalytic subunit